MTSSYSCGRYNNKKTTGKGFDDTGGCAVKGFDSRGGCAGKMSLDAIAVYLGAEGGVRNYKCMLFRLVSSCVSTTLAGTCLLAVRKYEISQQQCTCQIRNEQIIIMMMKNYHQHACSIQGEYAILNTGDSELDISVQ